MIFVTKPFLPPKEDYDKYIEFIYDSSHLTNFGKLHNQLETKLKEYLNISDLALLNNCTDGLLIAIKSLNLKGEIITTPFSFVATTSSIVWNNCKPIFCDIDENTLFPNLDLIEKLITKKTTAILFTHIFGNTGDLDRLIDIAKKNKLKIIFDAAHAFGVTYKNKSILDYGDISVVSLHSTKLYHTIEGGLITAKDKSLLDKIKIMRNFGISNNEIVDLGINAKMSEFNSAMGLCNLNHIDDILISRKNIYNHYLNNIKNKDIRFIEINKDIEQNYSYCPIIFKNEEKLLKCVEKLNEEKIYPRRYFYPSLNTLGYVKKSKCKVSEKIAKTILCLPSYYDLSIEDLDKIIKIINSI